MRSTSLGMMTSSLPPLSSSPRSATWDFNNRWYHGWGNDGGENGLLEINKMLMAAQKCWIQTSTQSSSSWRGVWFLFLLWSEHLFFPYELTVEPSEEGGSKDVQHHQLQQGGLWYPITVKLSLRKSSETHNYGGLPPTELKPLCEGQVFNCV